MFRVVEAARGYLLAKGSRAPSRELFDEMIRRRILREDQAAVLSSYLSRAKDVFDNKRYEGGYGLREWLNGGTRPMS